MIQVTVNWLTEEGGDVQHQNEDGATVLHFAVLGLNVELVQVLLDHNAGLLILQSRNIHTCIMY